MIEQNISDSSIGTKRKVAFDGIEGMSIKSKVARIVWVVTQYDSNDNEITVADINQNRIVISPISNENQVDPQTGITAEVPTEGTVPEFDFWWEMLNSALLPQVLMQAIQILDSQGRFDRP